MGNKQSPSEYQDDDFNPKSFKTQLNISPNKSPNKRDKEIKSNNISPSKNFKEDELVLNKKSKSEKKDTKDDKIFGVDKPFEGFDSNINILTIIITIDTNIFGYHLNTDPEEREYFISCPVCRFVNLDHGFGKNITYVYVICFILLFFFSVFILFLL